MGVWCYRQIGCVATQIVWRPGGTIDFSTPSCHINVVTVIDKERCRRYVGTAASGTKRHRKDGGTQIAVELVKELPATWLSERQSIWEVRIKTAGLSISENIALRPYVDKINLIV